jgi:hypothetical protein
VSLRNAKGGACDHDPSGEAEPVHHSLPARWWVHGPQRPCLTDELNRERETGRFRWLWATDLNPRPVGAAYAVAATAPLIRKADGPVPMIGVDPRSPSHLVFPGIFQPDFLTDFLSDFLVNVPGELSPDPRLRTRPGVDRPLDCRSRGRSGTLSLQWTLRISTKRPPPSERGSRCRLNRCSRPRKISRAIRRRNRHVQCSGRRPGRSS